MSVTAVVGLQWGDEGKGKIVDFLGEKADVVVRCQGGANAGHTVVLGSDVFKLHLIPSGSRTSAPPSRPPAPPMPTRRAAPACAGTTSRTWSRSAGSSRSAWSPP